jgi:hypothetical protein
LKTASILTTMKAGVTEKGYDRDSYSLDEGLLKEQP